MKNAIIVISGGLDSTVAAYYVKKRLNYDKIKFLFFDYNQKSLKEEELSVIKTAKILNAELKKINLQWLGEISTAILNKDKKIPETTEKDLEEENKDLMPWWVPCRNSIFLIAALAYAESEYLKNKEKYDIFIGLINEGRVHMKDTTKEFIESINNLQKHATDNGNFKIFAPLIDKDKTEIIKLGKELNVPFELTYSCYIENGPCGKCLNCMLRKKAFYWAGIEDTTFYKQQPN